MKMAQSVKENVLKMVKALPDDISVEDIMLHLNRKEKLSSISDSNPVEAKNQNLRNFHRYIEEELEKIQTLSDGWYDPNTPAFEKEVVETTRQELIKMAEHYWNKSDRLLPHPDISPCVDGTIDIAWMSPSFKFVINIEDGCEEFVFYIEDDGNKTEIQGTTLDLSTEILKWQAELEKLR